MINFNWKCPFCGLAQVVTDDTYTRTEVSITNGRNKYGRLAARIVTIVCANKECGEITIQMEVGTTEWLGNFTEHWKERVWSWHLRPDGSAKPVPPSVPEGIGRTYTEGAKIVATSPTAAGVMARRCLQGMIRDFCHIERRTLDAEIAALRNAVQQGEAPQGVTIDSIEALRRLQQLGNIGAHMKGDVNVMQEVSLEEARAMLGLIEVLFEEWYVNAANRARLFGSLRKKAEENSQDARKTGGDPAEGQTTEKEMLAKKRSLQVRGGTA